LFSSTTSKEFIMSKSATTTDATDGAAKKADAEAKAKALNDKIVAAEQAAVEKAKKKAEHEAAAKVSAEERATAAKARAEAAAAKKAERDARAEELKAAGRNYVGSMLSLAERVKAGAYVKSMTGQLRCNDELAMALDAVPVANVVALGLAALGLTENKYAHLNIGQQSMNLRNRMRGAIKKGDLTIDKVIEIRDANGYATAEAAAAEKARIKAEKEAKKAADVKAKEEAKIKAEKEAKKAADVKAKEEAKVKAQEAAAEKGKEAAAVAAISSTTKLAPPVPPTKGTGKAAGKTK
jgi:colicin import membrane protein